MPGVGRLRRLAVTAGLVLPIAVAGAIVSAQKWHGPTVLALSAAHGVDTGDLLAFPFALLAVAVARRRSGRTAAPGRALPASAVVLGALLALAAVVASAGGGSLVPAGGATLDGTIKQTVGAGAERVGRWTNVALTYDGALQRLYVNGRIVSTHAATGRIETPDNPLWIGGNHPYGEHFDGLLDEIRVYDRALSPEEIRHDMTAPVRPARGLEAAYAFDAGTGSKVTDSSGNGNTGAVAGATWARGRRGDALRFDGRDAVVRVPPSPSLNLTQAMTLSGWVEPTKRQSGWRTIVQRQVDAYFLTAGSSIQNRYGIVDDIRIALVVAAALWFCAVIATGRGPASAARRRSWALPVALFVLGAFADAACAPTATLIAPALVALWLSATTSSRVERIASLLCAAACAGLTLASLTDTAGVARALAHNEGGTARTSALGVLFVLAGVAAAVRRGEPDLGVR